MKTLRVRELMSTRVITVEGRTRVEDAARRLSEHHVSGAPVVDGGRIVGVVSQSDLVVPKVQDGAHRVAQVMTRVVYAVQPGDPAVSAARLMVEENVHRCVVVDDRGALVGIISAMDIMRALARGDFHKSTSASMMTHAEPAMAIEYVDLRTLDL
jgi:CBS domain-containing protein